MLTANPCDVAVSTQYLPARPDQVSVRETGSLVGHILRPAVTFHGRTAPGWCAAAAPHARGTRRCGPVASGPDAGAVRAPFGPRVGPELAAARRPFGGVTGGNCRGHALRSLTRSNERGIYPGSGWCDLLLATKRDCNVAISVITQTAASSK